MAIKPGRQYTPFTTAEVDFLQNMAGLSYSEGDVLYIDASGDITRLAAGSSGNILTTQGANNPPTWTSSGAGDVTGPGSSTDNAIARFDGTGGKTLQNSGILIDDSDSITGVSSATIDGNIISKGSAVFNEDGGDFDFRVESQNVTNMIFADADENQVAIGGVADPNYGALFVYGRSPGSGAEQDIVATLGEDEENIQLQSGNTDLVQIVQIQSPTLTRPSPMTVASAATLRIENNVQTSGNITITDNYALWVDAGNTRLDANLDVKGTSTLGTYTGSGSITTVGTISTGTWQGTTIAVGQGGTGGTTASSARTNLGLEIGTDVQAWDTDLDGLAGLSSTGLVVRTGSGSFTERSITSGAPITVTRGSGVTGNPKIGVSAASTTASGVIEIATNSETTTGSDSSRAVVPSGLDAARGQLRGVEEETTAPYTFVTDDRGKLKQITFNTAGSAVIETNANQSFSVGDQIAVARTSASIDIAGTAGVTVHFAGGVSTIGESDGFAYLVKVGTNEWRTVISG